MVDITISRLLNVQEVFARLEPSSVASILSGTLSSTVWGGFVPIPLLRSYLRKIARVLIQNIESVVDIKSIVVDGMTRDPAVLGNFFQRVGSKELSFLIESGTYFGFLLGLLQMLLWMILPANWTLPVAGAVVGSK